MTDQGSNNGLMMSLQWYLRSFVNKRTHAVSHDLYYATQHEPPRIGLAFVNDEDARSLPFDRVRPRKECPQRDCFVDEDIAIPLTDARLRTHQQTGFRIKVGTLAGYANILDITPVMIRLQLEAIDKELQELGPATVAVANNPPPAPLAAAAPAPPQPLPWPKSTSPQLGLHGDTDLVTVPGTKAKGVRVTKVEAGTIAEAAGLHVGDIIVACNGTPIKDAMDIQRAAMAIHDHGRFTVRIYRPDTKTESTITLSR